MSRVQWTIEESDIHARAAEGAFARGEAAFEEGSVLELIQRGEFLQGRVDGGGVLPLRVDVRLGGEGILWTKCSCPFELPGDCRHVVAVLLQFHRYPEDVDVRPSLSEQLQRLEAQELRELWLELFEQQVEMYDWFESHLPLVADAKEVAGRPAAQKPPPATPAPVVEVPQEEELGMSYAESISPSQVRVDPSSVRWRVHAAIHSLDHLQPDDARPLVGDVLEELRELLDKANPFLDEGDGQNALLFLDAFLEEWSNEWHILEALDPDSSDLWYDFDAFVAEGLLCPEISEAQKSSWSASLGQWDGELKESAPDAFVLSLEALREGWDDPQLVRVLEGGFPPISPSDTEEESREDDDEWERLETIRLRILKREGRQEEYLHLAQAHRLYVEWLSMLLSMGRGQEALDQAMVLLRKPGSFLAMAKAFEAAGQSEAALSLVQKGVAFRGPEKGQLYLWGRQLAEGAGELSLARDWAQELFEMEPSLEAFQAVEELSSEGEWPSLREGLLEILERSPESEARLRIYLQEGLYDEASQCAEASEDPALWEIAVDALWALRPKWARSFAQTQAEALIESTKAENYPLAARWLQRAQDAAEAEGVLPKFQKHLRGLLSTHSRKRKLKPSLEELLKSTTSAIRRGRRSARVLLAMQDANPDATDAIEEAQRFLEQSQDEALYRSFVDGLSPSAREFLTLLEQQGNLLMSDAKEALQLESERMVGGMVGSIKRRANKLKMQPPYTTGLTGGGERFWQWIGPALGSFIPPNPGTEHRSDSGAARDQHP